MFRAYKPPKIDKSLYDIKKPKKKKEPTEKKKRAKK